MPQPPPQKSKSSHWWSRFGSPTQKHYDEVANELRQRRLHEGLWARAFANSSGDVDRARATYVRLRAEQLAAKSHLHLYDWTIGALIILAVIVIASNNSASRRKLADKPHVPTIPAWTPVPYSAATLTPKASGARDSLATSLPRPTRSADSYVPTTNGIIYDLYPGGEALGRLRVENGTEHHAIAKLIDLSSNVKVTSFVIRANTNGGLKGVPDGTYRLVFAFGDAIIKGTDRFEAASGFSAFKETLPFVTSPLSDRTQYSEFRVTLHKVAGGNAPTTPITEEEFNRY